MIVGEQTDYVELTVKVQNNTTDFKEVVLPFVYQEYDNRGRGYEKGLRSPRV